MLGIDRRSFSRATRVRLLRQRIDTWYQCLPIPPGFKTWMRRVPVRLGLRPLFGWSLNRIAQFSLRKSGA